MPSWSFLTKMEKYWMEKKEEREGQVMELQEQCLNRLILLYTKLFHTDPVNLLAEILSSTSTNQKIYIITALSVNVIKGPLRHFLKQEQVFEAIFSRTTSHTSEYFLSLYSKIKFYWIIETESLFKSYDKYIYEELNYFMHECEAGPNERLAEYLKYTEIVINYCLFLLHGGFYLEVEKILDYLSKSLHHFLTAFNDVHPMNNKEKTIICSTEMFCKLLLFTISNDTEMVDFGKPFFENYDEFINLLQKLWEIDYSEKYLTQYYTMRHIYLLQICKYLFLTHNFQQSLKYIEILLNVTHKCETLYKLPLKIVIETLMQASLIYMKWEKFDKSKMYIETCFAIIHHIIIPQACKEVIDNNLTSVYNSEVGYDVGFYVINGCSHGTNILYLECLGVFAQLLAATDNMWSAKAVANWAYYQSEHVLGRVSMKVAKLHNIYANIKYKSQAHRGRIFFTWGVDDIPDIKTTLKMYKTILGFKSEYFSKSLLVAHAQTLHIRIDHNVHYCHYMDCPENGCESDQDDMYKEEGVMNKRYNRFSTLSFRYKKNMQLFTTCFGCDSYEHVQLFYNFALLIMQEKIFKKTSRYLRSKNSDLQQVREFIEKAYTIESNYLGVNHHKVVAHRALFYGEFYKVLFLLGEITFDESMDWKNSLERCIEVVKNLFGPTCNTLRYCYTQLQYFYKFNVLKYNEDDSYTKELEYELLSSNWEVLRENKMLVEKQGPWKTRLWINSSMDSMPDDWTKNNIILHPTETTELITQLLKQYNCYTLENNEN